MKQNVRIGKPTKSHRRGELDIVGLALGDNLKEIKQESRPFS
jgi:hypothetical protein